MAFKIVTRQPLKEVIYCQVLYWFQKTSLGDSGLFKVNQEVVIFGFDLEVKISICVRKWELKTPILGC